MRVRALCFHLSDGLARGCGDGFDSLGSFAEFHGIDELSGHPARPRRRDRVWRDVRQRQRARSICKSSSSVTTAILFLVAAQLVISGLHELSETGFLPSSKREMAIIGPIVSNDWFFFVTIFALAALMVLFDAKRRAAGLACDGISGRAAQGRLEARRERLWMGVGLYLLVLLHCHGHGGVRLCQEGTSISPATEVTFTNGKVSIPLAQISDGDLHRFQAQPRTARRFVSGSIRSRMERLPRCLTPARSAARSAFIRAAIGVVCKNCSAPINPQSVGSPGGCNPVPLKATQTADAIIIRGGRHCGGSRMFATISDVCAAGLRILPAAETAQAAGGRGDHAGRHRRHRDDCRRHRYRRQDQPRTPHHRRQSHRHSTGRFPRCRNRRGESQTALRWRLSERSRPAQDQRHFLAQQHHRHSLPCCR